MFLLRPFTILYAILKLLIWKSDNNAIKNNNILKGRKTNSITKEFDMRELKRISRHFNATVNDVVLALTSMSLKQYLEKRCELETTSVNMLVPFSLRTLPRTSKQHKLHNEFSLLCFTLQLRNKFEDAMKLVS